jgi:hypothetical protein
LLAPARGAVWGPGGWPSGHDPSRLLGRSRERARPRAESRGSRTSGVGRKSILRRGMGALVGRGATSFLVSSAHGPATGARTSHSGPRAPFPERIAAPRGAPAPAGIRGASKSPPALRKAGRRGERYAGLAGGATWGGAGSRHPFGLCSGQAGRRCPGGRWRAAGALPRIATVLGWSALRGREGGWRGCSPGRCSRDFCPNRAPNRHLKPLDCAGGKSCHFVA